MSYRYEPGFVVNTAAILIVLNWITDLLKVVNPTPLMKHYWHGRFALSQSKQDEVWKPVPFNEGLQYSITIKSVALGLVYGPIWPLAYLLTAIGLALSWICTRAGLRHWYLAPADVKADMMMLMRWRLGNVLGLSLLVQMLAGYYATNYENANAFSASGVLLIGGPLVMSIYCLLPLGAFWHFTLHDELASADEKFEAKSEGTQDPKARRQSMRGESELEFDDVTRVKGFDMPRYQCPLVSITQTMFSTSTLEAGTAGTLAEASGLKVKKTTSSSSFAKASLGHQASFILHQEGFKSSSREANAPALVGGGSGVAAKPSLSSSLIVQRSSSRGKSKKKKSGEAQPPSPSPSVTSSVSEAVQQALQQNEE